MFKKVQLTPINKKLYSLQFEIKMNKSYSMKKSNNYAVDIIQIEILLQ